MAQQYYQTNAIYKALTNTKHDFQWVSGNAWLLVYGNKSDKKAKILVLVHGTSWEIQIEIINTLNIIAKKLQIPVYKIMFDDSNNNSISEVAFSTSLNDEGEMYFLNELKKIFHNAGLDIIDGQCDKYLNDKTSSAYHKWQRLSLGNKIIVTDLDLIRIDPNSNEPVELIELKRSTTDVNRWKPYSDDFANFNLIDTISQQTNIPLCIVYNKMIKDKNRKVIIDDIYDPVSIFSYTNNNYKEIIRNCSFSDFVKGNYTKKIHNNLKINVSSRVCKNCNQPFVPRIPSALLCIDCWKKEHGY